jgi:hypothetical protein
MNANRYKTLLSYLPGMAAVVNSFQSQDVQMEVYHALIGALDEKEVSEGKAALSSRMRINGRSLTLNDDVAHDLVDGASIHAEVS